MPKEILIGIEGGLVLAAVITFIILVFAPERPLQHPEYGPNAVTGFATLSGVLAAFTGFWLIHIYSNASEKTKSWLSKRIAVIVTLIGFCLVIIIGSLSCLVYETVARAIFQATSAMILMFLIDMEVCILTIYKAFGEGEIGQ